MSERVLLAGVDSGGTRTVAVVADAGGAVLGRGEAGPGNPHAVGFDLAAQHVADAVCAALADAGLSTGTGTLRAVVGMAGGGLEADRARVRVLIATRLERSEDALEIVEDVALLLPAAGLEWGIALVAGTGSSAYAVAPDGATAMAGGWGYLVGDDGSAFWIGRQALRAMARADDGYGPATSLNGTIPGFLEVKRPRDVIPPIYRSSSPRLTIASLAPLVTDAARSGDRVAREICDEAAERLADLAAGLARRLRLPPKTRVVWAGGLTKAGDVLADPLRRALARRSAGILGVLDREPVLGGLRLALGRGRMAGG